MSEKMRDRTEWIFETTPLLTLLAKCSGDTEALPREFQEDFAAIIATISRFTNHLLDEYAQSAATLDFFPRVSLKAYIAYYSDLLSWTMRILQVLEQDPRFTPMVADAVQKLEDFITTQDHLLENEYRPRVERELRTFLDSEFRSQLEDQLQRMLDEKRFHGV